MRQVSGFRLQCGCQIRFGGENSAEGGRCFLKRGTRFKKRGGCKHAGERLAARGVAHAPTSESHRADEPPTSEKTMSDAYETTRWGIPSKKDWMFSMSCVMTRRLASTVAHPMCGVMYAFGAVKRGFFALGGSCDMTSAQ